MAMAQRSTRSTQGMYTDVEITARPSRKTHFFTFKEAGTIEGSSLDINCSKFDLNVKTLAAESPEHEIISAEKSVSFDNSPTFLTRDHVPCAKGSWK